MPAAEPKTRPIKQCVAAFIESLQNEGRREDSKILLSLFEKVTGEKPVMWGTAIVGLGQYQGSHGYVDADGFRSTQK